MIRSRKAFTLIELLIVIAIIAILALIAIPNFIQAQTRAKVSRAMADMRSVATALESYFVDNNAYPVPQTNRQYNKKGYGYFMWFETYDPTAPGESTDYNNRMKALTTPIAYMSTRPPADPFHAIASSNKSNFSYFYYNFMAAAKDREADPTAWSAANLGDITAPAPLKFNGDEDREIPAYWAMFSIGPTQQNLYHDLLGQEIDVFQLVTVNFWNKFQKGGLPTYDPTNGVVTMGQIWRVQGDRQF